MRAPSVLVPYPGPTSHPDEQDVAVYLRPESNGVKVEGTMLRVIRQMPEPRDRIRMIYLANIPGSFIAERGVVAEHYAVRVHFARAGKAAFTAPMARRFEAAFGTPFPDAPILGAFEALETLRISAEELFEVWVPPERFAVILGQTVKPYGGYYIMNYDIPALLARHNEHTDVFSMILRSALEYAEVVRLVREIEKALRDEQIVSGPARVSRVLHYSKGPFEQILDGLGYLYAPDGTSVPLRDVSFARYLLEHGISEERILDVVRHPLVTVATSGGTEEVELFEHTRGDSYAAALAKLGTVTGPVRLPVPPA